MLPSIALNWYNDWNTGLESLPISDFVAIARVPWEVRELEIKVDEMLANTVTVAF